MKNKNKLLIYSVSALLLLAGCSNIKDQSYNLPVPDTKVSVVKNTENGLTISDLKKDKLVNNRGIENISDLTYSSKGKVGAFVLDISHGNTFTHNKIVINDNSKMKVLNKFYSSQDIKMSPEGQNLAYRSFSKDDYSGAEGVKIYNIEKNKYINMKSDILISGSLYCWLNDDQIIYYGVSNKGNSGGKIYKYDFTSNSESVYFEKIDGFCTYFIPYDNKGLLFLEQDINEDRLCYFDFADNKKLLLTKDITDISAYSISRSGNEIYLICKNGTENSASLYRFSVQDKALERITYDFPDNVDKNGGIAVDEDGKVYFLGTLSAKSNNDSLFSYSSTNKSINLVLNYNNGLHIFEDSLSK